MFEVRPKLLNYLKAPGVYNGLLSVNCLYPMSVAKCAFLRLAEEATGTQIIQRVDYNTPQEVSSGHPAVKNVV